MHLTEARAGRSAAASTPPSAAPAAAQSDDVEPCPSSNPSQTTLQESSQTQSPILTGTRIDDFTASHSRSSTSSYSLPSSPQQSYRDLATPKQPQVASAASKKAHAAYMLAGEEPLEANPARTPTSAKTDSVANLLQGAIQNVGTISAGENARRARKDARRPAAAGTSSNAVPGASTSSNTASYAERTSIPATGHRLAGSVSSTSARPNSTSRSSVKRQSSSKRMSANSAHTSAASLGHGSSSFRERRSYTQNASAGDHPIPVPPPRITSSIGFNGLSSLAPNPGFVSETVAELNAAARAAQEAAAASSSTFLRSTPRSSGGIEGRTTSGGFYGLHASASASALNGGGGSGSGSGGAPKRDTPASSNNNNSSSSPARRPTGSGAGGSRRMSARSLKSDGGHSTRYSANKWPPMPEVPPPRGSSMHHHQHLGVEGGSGAATGPSSSVRHVPDSMPTSSSTPAGLSGSYRTQEQVSPAGLVQLFSPPSSSAGRKHARDNGNDEEDEQQEEIRQDGDFEGVLYRRPTSSTSPYHMGGAEYSPRLHEQQSPQGVARAVTEDPYWPDKHLSASASTSAQQQRSRRATVDGTQRSSLLGGSGSGSQGLPPVPSIPVSEAVAAQNDAVSLGRPSFSSVRSVSVWQHGDSHDVLPSVASHGHGSGVATSSSSSSSRFVVPPATSMPVSTHISRPVSGASLSGIGLGSGLRRSASPHSPAAAAAALSPEHQSVRLSYGSSGVSSGNRTQESMYTARSRSSMSATNGHGLELDGLSVYSHDYGSSVGGEHQQQQRFSGVGVPALPVPKRGSGVPSLWIGPARAGAGDETEDGEEFFDARSDEGDEGEDSEDEVRSSKQRHSRRPKNTAGTSVGDDEGSHSHATAGVGSGVAAGSGSIVAGARTVDGLLLPPVVLSVAPPAEEVEVTAAPSGTRSTLNRRGSHKNASSSSAAASSTPSTAETGVTSAPYQRRSRTRMRSSIPLEDDNASSSNSSNEASHTYGSRLRAEQSASRLRSRHSSRHGHGQPAGQGSGLTVTRPVPVPDSSERRSSIPADAVVNEKRAEDVDVTVVPAQVADSATPPAEPQATPTALAQAVPSPPPETAETSDRALDSPASNLIVDFGPLSKSMQEREAIAREKTQRRLAKVQGSAARQQEAAAAAAATASGGLHQHSTSASSTLGVDTEGPVEHVCGTARASKETGEEVPLGFVPRPLTPERAVEIFPDESGPPVADSAVKSHGVMMAEEPLVIAAPILHSASSVPEPAPEPPRRKSLDARLARKLDFFGLSESNSRSPEVDKTRRSSRGVDFSDQVRIDDAEEASTDVHGNSKSGRKRGLSALFSRSRRKSTAATTSRAPFVAGAADGNAAPMPSPSILNNRRPPEPSIQTQDSMFSSPEIPSMPAFPTHVQLPSSASAPPAPQGLGFAFESEQGRPETPADGRTTPYGRWRTRLPSMSGTLRTTTQSRRPSESQAPPVPPLPWQAAAAADEDWRRNLLTDAVEMSLGLSSPRIPRSESRNGYRGGDERPKSRGGYRSGDERPRSRGDCRSGDECPITRTARPRRPVTPLPVDNSDVQETIKKSLSTPLLSDDLVDDGDESHKIDKLLMDLDNGLLVDSFTRHNGASGNRARSDLIPAQGILMDRSLSGQSERSVHQARVILASPGPRIHSTIMEDVPHQSRSQDNWKLNGLHQGATSGDDSNLSWSAEPGPGSHGLHVEGDRLRLDSQASLPGGGLASGTHSDAEGNGDVSAGDGHHASLPSGVFEQMGRVSKSVDHHHMSSTYGSGGDLELLGAASAQGHGSVGRGSSRQGHHRPGGGGVLSSLKARLRGQRHAEVSALGIGHVPLSSSQALGYSPYGPSVDHGRSVPASLAHGSNSLGTSLSTSYNGNQQSFIAAQEATNRLLATGREMDFTPSLSHSPLPPESPSVVVRDVSQDSSSIPASLGNPAFQGYGRNPLLIPPSPTAWSFNSSGDSGGNLRASATAPALSHSGMSPSSSSATLAASRRTSTPDVAAFDQMLRGYSAANSVLVRQIAARASSSNNHAPAVTAS
ncbi:hypothetical protein V8E36_009630 [Tilletia maclaganii]